MLLCWRVSSACVTGLQSLSLLTLYVLLVSETLEHLNVSLVSKGSAWEVRHPTGRPLLVTHTYGLQYKLYFSNIEASPFFCAGSCYPRVGSFPCAKFSPGAKCKMLLSFCKVHGRCCRASILPKSLELVVGKANFPLVSSFTLLTVGTYWIISRPSSKKPLISGVFYFQWNIVHTVTFQIGNYTESTLYLLFGQSVTCVPGTGWGGLCLAALCRGWSQRRRLVRPTLLFLCRSLPAGILPAPCLPLGSFCYAAFSFPAFWHA